ncbi:hypothetical protein K491DRAFT_688878 [Lophiostoma macrostomum CBS 122681]|uniref:Peptidase S28 n=1 Tax=Lophiostoma macrostomum CBS 122681 TaxID=1314788 RepID=A0A6A6TKP7_9PLEO|nr:hypothetical protein K491DRAFT_688878 [Lophiostoma macrostomum CBS 122681]
MAGGVFSLVRTALTIVLLYSHSTIAQQFCPRYNTSQFEQKIDHFGKHNGTFAQRYQLVTDFFKPGGPVLLLQGAEISIFSCIEYFSLVQYAHETNALLLNINHRYFNDSVPFGVITDTTYDWQYLTLENVLMDSVELVKYAKQEVPGAAESKVFAAGGSYGGFLSSMLRVNHPETFDGAIASGSPRLADSADFPNTTSQWIQADYISNVYGDLSKPVADAISQSWSLMEQLVTTGNGTGLQQELNLCTAPANATELALLQSLLVEGLHSVSEFNYPTAASTSTNVSYPLQYIISQSGSNPSPLDPLKAYASIGWITVNPQRPECYDWAAASSGFGHGISTASYTYITCTYFPLSAGTARNGTIFPASLESELTHASVTQMCAPYGNPHMRTPAEVEAAGLSQERLANTTNIIFTLGQYDPTTGYAVKEFELSANRSAPRRLFVSEMAHTQDLMGYNPLDSPPVLDVRNTTVQYIKYWAGLE